MTDMISSCMKDRVVTEANTSSNDTNGSNNTFTTTAVMVELPYSLLLSRVLKKNALGKESFHIMFKKT